MELDKKVFGKITTKEIIGADPSPTNTKELLEKELKILVLELDSQPKENLENILELQKNSESHINSRPGAMALAQDKIRLFNEFNQKYVQTVKEKLES